jgi:hypothetical protein
VFLCWTQCKGLSECDWGASVLAMEAVKELMEANRHRGIVRRLVPSADGRAPFQVPHSLTHVGVSVFVFNALVLLCAIEDQDGESACK